MLNQYVLTTDDKTGVDVSIQDEIEQKSPNMNLSDKYGRHHTYLRISLTEKCNLKCLYCMPDNGLHLSENSRILKMDEIMRLARIFANQGVRKIKLTGGEPTIRRDLSQIVEGLSQIDGIKDIGITTNGLLISKNLENLVKAGLTGINISLDTMNSHKYTIITRFNGFERVIKTIEVAKKLFETVKINTVVIRGVNDDEILDFIAMTENQNVSVRFIEYMPFSGNKFEIKKMVAYKEILKIVQKKFPMVVKLRDSFNSTSKMYQVYGYCGKFGFISSMTEHFCSSCNRLRITADGNLKMCLHGTEEVPLRKLLRSNVSDSEILSAINSGLMKKKANHSGIENLLKNGGQRPMILIGG